MTKYRIHIRAVMYPDFDSIYKYGQRISDPSRFGKVLGDVYSDMLDIPDINKNIDAEIDEATEYYTQSLSKARNTFQIHFNNILKKKPQNIEDINMINYTYQDGDNMTVIIVDVDYHDGADNVIEVTDSNVDDYFNVERVFKQEIVKSYHETEPDVYRLYDDDYFYRKNPFPDVYGREFDDDAVMGCRNFTFQVTEDCNLRCFAAGTMILMADLTKKPIERIVVGDEVLGFYRNEFDQIAFKKATIKRLFTNTARVITLTTPTGDTLVTPSHELYTSKGEYVKAALVRDAVNDLVMVEPYHEEKSVRPDVTIISPAEYNIDKKTLFNDPVQVYNISTETGNYIANDICVKNCSYCVAEGTKVTMADMSKKNIEDVAVGEKILGFDEFPEPGKNRHFKSAVVTDIFSRKADCIRIESPKLDEPIVVTPEHPFLTATGWKEAGSLTSRDVIYRSLDFDDVAPANINSEQYKTGYFIGGWVGDGSVINYTGKYRETSQYFMRFVVKDPEMCDRMIQYSEELGYNFNIRPFKISTKYDLFANSLQSNGKETYEKYQEMLLANLSRNMINNDRDFLCGFLASMFDSEGSNDGLTIRITNTDMYLLYCVQQALDALGFEYVYDKLSLTPNRVKTSIRIIGGVFDNIRFIKTTQPAILRKGIDKLLPHMELFKVDQLSITKDAAHTVYNLETDCHTFVAENVLVHNCYQTNKCATIMDIETAKSAVDDLLAGTFDYLSPGFSKSVILEFIGGDPLLEIDMIGEIYSYFLKEAYRLNHPWFRHNRISICSNGLLYFSKPSKKFFDRYAKETSFNISIDGNKSLHDACRIQPTGEGSYDIGIYGVHHSHDVYGLEISSKMTLAPSNIPMIKESVKNLCIDDNYPGINLNVVFEDVWQQKDARVLYDQLVGVADMVLKENRPDLYFSIFRNTQQIDPIYDVTTEMTGSCGGSSASMLSLSPQGIYYPCIRYMPSSLNGEMDALELGNTKDKMIENLRMLREFQMITRLTDQNDRCLSCPINHSCTDCTGLCYQTHGTANQRLYFICEMIKAEYLASIYYWGKLALQYPEFEIKTDTELAEYYQFENIISHDEYDELVKIVEQNVDRMNSMNLLD